VYHSLLTAWVKRCDHDTPLTSLRILDEMKARHKTDVLNQDVVEILPNQYDFSIVIKLFLRIGDTINADILLWRMINRFNGEILPEYEELFRLLLRAYRDFETKDEVNNSIFRTRPISNLIDKKSFGSYFFLIQSELTHFAVPPDMR
jgi:hypothetical protein